MPVIVGERRRGKGLETQRCVSANYSGVRGRYESLDAGTAVEDHEEG
jgi:hypothetical protein